ncbi:MAG: hypothetical protein FJ295_10015 [Planctomycetes bacterium]|nr:hypothetical protein [Planctomycetota bacterium]
MFSTNQEPQFLIALATLSYLLTAAPDIRDATAQQGLQSTVRAGRVVVSDGFYERFGIRWGIHGRGFFFDNGGPGPVPVFGGFDPNTQGQFGFAGRNGYFNLFAANGNSRSIVSNSAILTLPNGGYGEVMSSELRPFVTGVVPVVGDGSTSLLEERLHRLRSGERGSMVRRRVEAPADPGFGAEGELSRDRSVEASRSSSSSAGSSAVRGDLSLAEIRRRQAADDAARDTAVLELRDKGRQHEARGELGAARVFYQQALKRAQSTVAEELRGKLEELATKR